MNFLISLVVGVAASLSTGDAAGRRELIGMTAAQFAVYPAWFGVMLVLGLPNTALIGQRWLTILVNIITIVAVSIGLFLAMRYRGEVLKRYAD